MNISRVCTILFSCCAMMFLMSAGKTINASAQKEKSIAFPLEPQALWHDLVTPDIEDSKLFYRKVFGWTFKDYTFKGYNHVHIFNNGSLIGGMIEVKEAQSSTWIGSYPVSLENLKALKSIIEGSGLRSALQLINIPQRGRQFVFESPQGEEFALILENDMTRKATNSESRDTWLGIELWSSNPEEAKSFYEKAFGVSISKKEVDNAPYWVITSKGNTIAGMINNPVKNQGSQWVPYIKSNNLEALMKSIDLNKGTVLLNPVEGIREGKVGIAQDTHGAIFVIQKN
ncbi:MAG: hypothetical protein HRT65_16250 [Flavobacteriaceae bacterium]|nr:hypothetical protein [Flavobacteriaceae bacterium]